MSRYASYFPEKSDKKAIAQLKPIVRELAKKLVDVQYQMQFSTLVFRSKLRTVLAEILVDFALDLRSGSGIWSALEACNRTLFGTPLPAIDSGEKPLPEGLCSQRLHFLLWNIYPQLDPGTIISPKHVDLLVAVEEILPLLEKILPSLPDVSPVKTFLAGPNDYGWEIKRKLIWLGTQSYPFRFLFEDYIQSECDGEFEIAHIDDFVCQHTTSWSGLGVIDVLAECLDVPETQKDELRSWHMRHTSVYKIVKSNKETLEAVNLINDAPYTIRQAAPGGRDPGHFRKGSVIHGALVPWRGQWYWSGEQYDLTPYPASEIDNVLREFKLQTAIVCRYWKQREEDVRRQFKTHYEKMVEFYGGDFKLFPSGRAWEKAETKRMFEFMKKAGRMGQMPEMNLPDHLAECRNGVAMFIDPGEGMELMEEFNSIVSGLKKNGRNLTPDEDAMIRDWIQSDGIGPAFVHRVLKEYGGVESVKFAFRCETDAPCALEYLLRCNKGHYYRKRFPSLSICEDRF